MSDYTEAKLVVSKILELEQKFPLHEIAILFRSGYHSYSVEVELNKLGVPFQKFGGLKFSDAAHIKDALSFMKLTTNALDLPAFKRAFSGIKGVGPIFSVTDYVKSWYTGTPNYGFALKRDGGENYSVIFVAKEKMQIFAQLTINYTGTHFAEGVYAIRKANTNTYVKAYRPTSLAWVLQDSTSYTSPPLSVSHLENLFKISYRPATNDYVIRSMLENSLVIFPSMSNNAPIAGRLSENDSELSTDHTWKLVYTLGCYYITYTENGVTYYLRSTSANNDTILVLTTNRYDSGTKWSLNKYLGNTYENIVAEDFPTSLSIDETYQYHAYMRSTRINHNGPVSYSVTDTDG